jgi:hypothetical protein
MKTPNIVAAITLLACGCEPLVLVPADDAGDCAFAHQAVQTMLGRRPRGGAEVRALCDVAQSRGREAVFAVLQQEPEHVHYWTHVIMDGMKVQRSGEYAQKAACTDEPLYMVDAGGEPCDQSCLDQATQLADHLRQSSPSATQFVDADGVVQPFNLNDAVRAAIIVDDLHVAWRPYLVALAGDHQPAGTAEVRDNYMATAFGVRSDCMTCHASTYSTTEVYDQYGTNDWDRTSTVGVDLEVATFGTADAVDAGGAPDCDIAGVPASGGAELFASKCASASCHGPDGTNQPLIVGNPSPKVLTRRVPLLSDDAIANQIRNGGGGMPAQTDLDCDPASDNEEDIDELVEFLREELGGYTDLNRYLSEDQFLGEDDDCTDPVQALQPDCVNAATMHPPFGMSDTCGMSWAPDLVTNPNDLRAFAGIARDTNDVEDILVSVRWGLEWIRLEPSWGLGTAAGTLPLPFAAKVGPATLLARDVADDILHEVAGVRMHLEHGLARNDFQTLGSGQLVDWLLVDDGQTQLSLGNVLAQVLTSKVYNRAAPRDMAPEGDDGSAYQLLPFLNPWAATSDGNADSATGANLNGQGDLAHRRSPNQLLWSLHGDLGWPEPTIDPSGGAYPANAFMSNIGRWESTLEPGTTVWAFDSLLLFEAELGTCENPGSGNDYIARLAYGIELGFVAGTVSEAALTLKDRLLQESVYTADEEPLVLDLFEATLGAGTFYTDASLVPNADLEAALRQYCGALLLSPDYLMAGIPTVTVAPLPAPMTVCLTDEDAALLCTESDLFAHYDAAAVALGY